MNFIKSYGLPLLMLMTILLPLWLTAGRIMLGSDGRWIIGYIIIAPLLFVALWILYILLAARSDVRKTDSIGSVDSVKLIILYTVIFLHGFFAVEPSTPPQAGPSIAMNILPLDQSISFILSQVFLYLALGLFLSSFVFFAYELVKNRIGLPSLGKRR